MWARGEAGILDYVEGEGGRRVGVVDTGEELSESNESTSANLTLTRKPRPRHDAGRSSRTMSWARSSTPWSTVRQTTSPRTSALTIETKVREKEGTSERLLVI